LIWPFHGPWKWLAVQKLVNRYPERGSLAWTKSGTGKKVLLVFVVDKGTLEPCEIFLIYKGVSSDPDFRKL